MPSVQPQSQSYPQEEPSSSSTRPRNELQLQGHGRGRLVQVGSGSPKGHRTPSLSVEPPEPPRPNFLWSCLRYLRDLVIPPPGEDGVQDQRPRPVHEPHQHQHSSPGQDQGQTMKAHGHHGYYRDPLEVGVEVEAHPGPGGTHHHRAIDLMAATSLLQQKANDIRAERVNWQSYLHSQMLSQEDYNFIVAFDGSSGKARETLLEEQRLQCPRTFLNLMAHVSKNQTLHYILVVIDDMLMEDMSRVEIFKEYARKRKESVWAPFLTMLTRPDGFTTNMTSRILAKMACWSKELMDGSDLHFYLTWLRDQLKLPENEFIQTVGRCLQMMLRIDEYRFAFVAVDGVSTLVSVLAQRHNFQIQYQLTFCIWVLTFNPTLAEKMNKFNIIPILADILSDTVKEKVTRIVVAVLRNLIEKPEDEQICKEHCVAMVQARILKNLDHLGQRKFEDEDIEGDIKYLAEKLHESIVNLSSFDEYSSEIKSGRLEWSPVHKSERFWRENAVKLTDKNYELLKILITILETSKDPTVLSVAAYDIGEFVRHYSRGKTVLEQLGGKTVVMALLAHEDNNVRYEALLCVQKLMVQNWEYLGRQLEKETNIPTNKASA